jgi:hypothetical protein
MRKSKRYVSKLQAFLLLHEKLDAGQVSFRYHQRAKRIDIKIRAANGTPMLKICFEHGVARTLDKKEYWYDLYH